MKKLPITPIPFLLLVAISFVLLYSCSEANDDLGTNNSNQTLTEADKAALLFMLEEEKLARDTYMLLYDLWNINQFANIKNSEQSHMNAIEDILVINGIGYTIMPIGEFENQTLQELYNQFINEGAESATNAFQVGATIEDLDIVDLQNSIDATINLSLIAVFESLQCGSRNHLRSFVLGIENRGETYIPQFLSLDEFNSIINGNHEQCN